MKRFFLFLVILGTLFLTLTACQPAPLEDLPKTETLLVQITPAVMPVLPAVQACGALLPNVELHIVETFASQSDPGMLIRLGDLKGGEFSLAQIASEELTVILHPDNPAGSLTIDQIQGLFTGQISAWSDLGGTASPVAVWAFYPGDEAQQAFEQQVLEGVPLVSTATLAPSPEILRDAVAADPSAIGLLPSAWVREGLRSTLIGIRLPVLIASTWPLEGPAASLAACLQGETGQAILDTIYP